MHDLWHVVTGYGRDELGEACLLAFTYAQNKNRGVGFIAFVGCFKLFAKYRFNALRVIFQLLLARTLRGCLTGTGKACLRMS